MKVFIKLIKEIAQGFVIGIANVIPGFSGGTMAIIFQVYERIINAVSDFFSHPIKVIKDIWALAIGLLMGIGFAVLVIAKLLEIAPVPTIMFFVGLIIGTIPFIFMSCKSYGRIKLLDVICFIIAVIVLVILPLLGNNSIESVSFSFPTIIIMFALGIIAAATMVIPGVSGSLVLLTLGYYGIVLGSISDIIKIIPTFDFTNKGISFLVVIAFGIGAVIGLVFISKLIKMLLKKAPKPVYWTILGLLLASPYSIIMAMLKEYPNVFNQIDIWGYIISFIFLCIGAAISGLFSIYENKLKASNKIKNDDNEKQTI